MTEKIQYEISHKTHYKYSSPVAICQNQLRMMPRALRSATSAVRCHQVEMTIEPSPTIRQTHIDYYGNRVVSFSIESLHRELTVSVESQVTVATAGLDTRESPRWEAVSAAVTGHEDNGWLDAQQFMFDSPRVTRGEPFAEYARDVFQSEPEVWAATAALTRRIHQDFKYDSNATDVHTTTEEAFELRAGVCQDFAHIQIACLRSLGLPARYVSGYLRTIPAEGQPRLSGADESHAWISVYCGHELGWVDFDPTNNCLAGSNHIPICVGRDYSEVSPMRGVVVGGGTPTLKVQVTVQPTSPTTGQSDSPASGT